MGLLLEIYCDYYREFQQKSNRLAVENLTAVKLLIAFFCIVTTLGPVGRKQRSSETLLSTRHGN